MKEFVISVECKVTIEANDAASAMNNAKTILEKDQRVYVTSLSPLSETNKK